MILCCILWITVHLLLSLWQSCIPQLVHFISINNGNRTEWSPIQSVIIQLLKVGQPQSGSLICQSWAWLQSDRIGRHKVLSPFNHNHNNFPKNKYIYNKYLQKRWCLKLKIPSFWKFPTFSKDKWLLLWLLWSILWLVGLAE